MANEIQIGATVMVRNGNYVDSFAPGALSVAQTNIGRSGYVQTIPTSDTVVTISGLTANGYAVLRNLDATNYVVFGPTSGGAIVPFGKLKPGEFAIVRIAPTVVLRAQADTASVKLDVRVYED